MTSPIYASGFGGPAEFYSDSAKFQLSPYGVAITFGVQADSPTESRAQAIVRMSPQHAFVFCQLLRKNLREYQKVVGPIALPDELFAELGIDRDL